MKKQLFICLLVISTPILYARQIWTPLDEWGIIPPNGAYYYAWAESDPRRTVNEAIEEAERMAITNLAQRISVLVEEEYLHFGMRSNANIYGREFLVGSISTRLLLQGVRRETVIRREENGITAFSLASVTIENANTARREEGIRQRAVAAAALHISRGDGYLTVGNLPSAESQFLEASRIYPSPVVIQRLEEVRRLTYKQQRRQIAEADAARHIGIGNERLGRGEFTQAIAAFDSALQSVPGHSVAVQRRARAIRQRADAARAYIDRGHRYLSLSRENLSSAETSFRGALRIYPGNFEATRGLEEVERRRTDIQRRRATADAYIWHGNENLSRNRFLQAAANFEAARQVAPDPSVAVQRLEYAKDRRAEHFRLRLWSVGFAAGTSFNVAPLTFTEPLAMATIQATLAPFPRSFIRLGCDFGFMSGIEGVDYFSMALFLHYAFFIPVNNWGNAYIGGGGGFFMEEFRFGDGLTVSRGWPPNLGTGIITLDLTVGLIMWNRVHLSYTVRANLFDITDVIQNTVSVGWIFRFPHSIYHRRSR